MTNASKEKKPRRARETHKQVGDRIVPMPKATHVHLLVVRHGRKAPSIGYQVRFRQRWYPYSEWFSEHDYGNDPYRALRFAERAAMKHEKLAKRARRDAFSRGDASAAERVIADVRTSDVDRSQFALFEDAAPTPTTHEAIA